MRLREAILFAGIGVAACLGAVAPIAAADTEPGALTGRVTNESGQPVAGAVVRVQLGADLLSSPETREATSDAEGNYSIPLPLGQFFVLPVQAPAGYWVKYQPQLPHALTRGDSTRQFDVVLRRGIPVNVKWGADLQHAETLSVVADPTNSEPQRARQDEFEFSTSVTGSRSARATLPATAGRALMQLSDGSRPLGNTPLMVPADFHGDRVKKIAPDKIPRVVAITDDAGSVLQVAGATATESGGALTLEINTSIAPKRRQYVVRGKVVDSAGKPLPGATVALGLRNRRTTVTTAADGSYEIAGSEPRIGGSPPIGITFVLTAVKPGFAVASAPELEVPNSDTIEVEPLRLAASGMLRLRVIDALGEPAAGAWVHLGEFGFARTDAEGRLVDRTVAPGETSLRIQLGPLKYAGKVAVSADDAGAEQTITLR